MSNYQQSAQQGNAAWEREAQERLAARDYEAVLGVLAKLAGTGTISPDACYAGAYAYFMQGDYQRAATWVENTLTYLPSHVPARILLARLCILEDRTAEALSVLDVLLEAKNSLREAEQSEIREIAGYYGRTRKEMVCRDYPHIASFLQLAGDASASAGEADVATGSTEAAQGGGILALAQKKAEEIAGMPCSAKEKVQLLCSFAGAWYFDGELAAAELLLGEALRMDSNDSAALKGMALIAAESGDTERAVRFAACVRPTDFLLLQRLRDAKKIS